MAWILFLVKGKKLSNEDYEQLKQTCQTKRGAITMLEHALERDRQQYLMKGKAERDREIALKLLADKVDINIIVNATGLSMDEIMALHDENSKYH
jgi:hypothetical protein